MAEHPPMPVAGYTSQSADKIAAVNDNKETEERLLRVLDVMLTDEQFDKRWIAIARTHFEEGFMALNRAVFRPQRIELPEDGLL
jgi:hypothetical protein